MKTLTEWLAGVLPLLLAHDTNRIDGEVVEGLVKAYWVVGVLRIDLQPNEVKS